MSVDKNLPSKSRKQFVKPDLSAMLPFKFGMLVSLFFRRSSLLNSFFIILLSLLLLLLLLLLAAD
jgi:hypothetical protein